MDLSNRAWILGMVVCGMGWGEPAYGVRPRACSIDWVIEELAQLDAELAEVERGVYSARTPDPEIQASLAHERKELEALTERSLEAGPSPQWDEIQEALSERSSGVASVREKAKESRVPPVSGVRKISASGAASAQRRSLSEVGGFAEVEAESVYPLPWSGGSGAGSTGEIRVLFHPRCLKAILGLESETQQRFWSALLNGPVGSEGSNGIKRLSGQGGRRLAFEIKHRSVEVRIYGCLRREGVIEFLFVDNHKAAHRIYGLCEK